jgi:hypothetical protein
LRFTSHRGSFYVSWIYGSRTPHGGFKAPPGKLFSTDYSGVNETHWGFGLNRATGAKWAPQGAAVFPWWSAVALFLLLPAFAAVRWWRRLPSAGRCAKCAYDLTGNVSGVCPECGRKIADLKS